MAAFVKYNSFIDELSKGGHNLQLPPVLKVALTNTAFEGMIGRFTVDVRNAVYGG